MNTVSDIIKATRKGNREAEREILGDGFHVRTRIVRSKKRYYRTYTRQGEHDIQLPNL